MFIKIQGPDVHDSALNMVADPKTNRPFHYIFQGNAFEIKQFFPAQVKQLKNIAETCSNETAAIEEKFESLIRLTSEIISASNIKKGVTISTKNKIEEDQISKLINNDILNYEE